MEQVGSHRPAVRRDERGVGTLFTVGVCVALVAVAWGAAVAVAWFALARQVSGAADLAAIAGAAALAEGDDACAASRDAAARNSVTLAGCDVRNAGGGFVVEVAVSAPLQPALPMAPAQVRRSAAAGST